MSVSKTFKLKNYIPVFTTQSKMAFVKLAQILNSSVSSWSNLSPNRVPLAATSGFSHVREHMLMPTKSHVFCIILSRRQIKKEMRVDYVG